MNRAQRIPRRSRLFAVTAPYTDVSKQFVFDALNEFCIKLCVSEEKHYNGMSHHHLYLKTIEALTTEEVKRIIGMVYDTNNFADDLDADDEDLEEDEQQFARELAAEHGLHVTKVRSERNYLKYITKEDHNPLLKNINHKMLSFYFRAIEWASNTLEYKEADPFILAHPQFYNLLKHVHACVHASKKQQANRQLMRYQEPPRQPIVTDQIIAATSTASVVAAAETTAIATAAATETATNGSTYLPWNQQVIEWWNDWIDNGFRPKKKQLYLWGPSNTGKSYLVKNLLRHSIPVNRQDTNVIQPTDDDAYEEHVFRPTPHDERFAYEAFDELKHSVMAIDEFDWKEYKISDLKKAAEGSPLIAGQKGGASKRIRLRMPMILISNMPLPDEKDPKNAACIGLNSRFKIVSTHGGPLFQN